MSQHQRENGMTRREFLRAGLTVAGAATALGALNAMPASAATLEPMKTPAPTEASPAQQAITLSLWYDTWGPASIWENAWAEVKKQVGVDLNVTVTPFDDIEAKVFTALAAGMTPDLLFNHPAYVATYATKGVTLPLDDMVKNTGYDLSGFFKGGLDCLSYGGQLHGLPCEISVNVLYYNTEMVDKAGLQQPYDLWKEGKWTAETFVDYAAKLTKGEGEAKQFGAFEPPKALKHQMPVIRGFGGEVWPSDFSDVTINSPKCMTAWKWMLDFAANGWSPILAGRESDYHKQTVALFNSRKLAMFTQHRSYLSSFNQDLPFGFAELPIWPALGASTTRMVSDGFGVGAKTQYPEQAFKSAHIVAETVNLGLVGERSAMPIKMADMELPVWTDTLAPFEKNDVWTAAANHATPDHLPPGYGEQDKMAEDAYEAVQHGEKELQAAFDEAQQSMLAALQEIMAG